MTDVRGMPVSYKELFMLFFLLLASTGQADSTVNSRIGELTFDSGYPTTL